VPELWIVVVVAGFATYFWRALGVFLSGRIQAESELFNWVGCVAYALVAGLISRIVIMPSGVLAQTMLPDRLAACALALAAYFLFRRNLFAGVGTGVVTLIIASAARGL
jgi:branched-subunit amino acid transport protein